MGVFWEVIAVVYIVVFTCTIARIHLGLARNGAMKWNSLTWAHVSRGCHSISPKWIAIMRIGFALYISVILWTAISSGVGGYVALGTFTVWCWTLEGVYFVLSGVASLSDACRSRENCVHSTVCANFLWVFFQVMFSYSWLVFLVVWLVLLPSSYIINGTDGGILSFVALSMHNANVLFMLIEMRLNRMNFVKTHLVFTLYYGCSYVAFSWLWYLRYNYFFYFFIDWTSPGVVGGYTLLLLLIWGVTVCSHKLVMMCKSRVGDELPNLDGPAAEALDARSPSFM